MTKREQLVKEVEELNLKCSEIFEELKTWENENRNKYINITLTKKYKSSWKSIMELDKQIKELKYQIELIDGKVWDNEKWVTSFTSTSSSSLKEARDELANMLSEMNGVEIENNKGIKVVYVTTKYKVYKYELHAHYGHEVIGTEKVKGIVGEYERKITKQIYYADLIPSGFGLSSQNWAWR